MAGFSGKNMIYRCLMLLSIFSSNAVFAQQRVLDSNVHYLRTGNKPEWVEYAEQSVEKELVISFTAFANRTQKTISFRQYGVKQPWRVSVNGHEVGKLITDENDIKVYFELAPEVLVAGKNTLRIEPVTSVADDIKVSEIVLDDRPVSELLSEALVEVEVVDNKTNSPLPCRITIASQDGVLQTIGARSNEQQAVRPGFVYTANGRTSFGVPAGVYTLYSGRGFEYSVDSVQIVVKPGERIYKRLGIYREVPTDNWVSCDTHIHTLTHSGHGDATVQERVITIAGEGIELPVMTDHNVRVNIAPVAKALGLDTCFTPVTGTELTTDVGHFNIFPVTPESQGLDHRIKNWKDLSDSLRNAQDEKIIILNHARDIHKGFRPFDPKHHIAVAGMRLDDWRFPANAMEVLNSGSLQTNMMQLFFDWFGMLNRGYLLTPVGSSDSHDVSRYLVGQARTYIRSRDNHPGSLDVKEAIENFSKGKVTVSFGLLTEITVNKRYGPGDLVPGAEQVAVTIRVLGPKWVQAKKLTLYANGKKIREAVIDKEGSSTLKWEGTWILPRSRHDFFLVALAEGPYHYLPFWPVVKPFQPTSPEWTPVIIGATGAVWIDADKDGRRTSASNYAQKIIKASQGNLYRLMNRLSTYDEAVAVQAAAILHQQGRALTGTAVRKALQQAGPATRAGFQHFIEQWQASQAIK